MLSSTSVVFGGSKGTAFKTSDLAIPEFKIKPTLRTSHKSVQLKVYFVISQLKRMLGVLNRTVKLKQFFWKPKIYG